MMESEEEVGKKLLMELNELKEEEELIEIEN